jgi:hypothetical protein
MGIAFQRRHAEAVVKSHEALGYLIETTDVIEVTSLT